MAKVSEENSNLLIAVINLKEATNRRAFFEEGWKEHVGSSILGVKPYFHMVDRDPEGGLIGCTRSHVACYKKAVDEGKDACLIFEDDVRPNSYFTPELLTSSLALICNGWDVIRLHKSGICKVHGAISSKFYHTSSLCGRCYLVSRSLMIETIREAGDNANTIVPYTSFLAKASSRHLTYHLTACEEGAFGSYNQSGGWARQNMGLALLQKSLDYTTFIETTVANTHFYFGIPSPLYESNSFPNATEFWRAYEHNTFNTTNTGEKKQNSVSDRNSLGFEQTIDWYRLNIGSYEKTSPTTMIQALGSRLLGNCVKLNPINPAGIEGLDTLIAGNTGLYSFADLKHSRDNPPLAISSAQYDVVIVGGGIAGSSCYYWLSEKFGRRVLLLEQNSNSTIGDKQTPDAIARSERSKKGSSGGGPRRIGLLELASGKRVKPSGKRVKQAWELWKSLQKEAEFKTKNSLAHFNGEVIVVNIFPLGWLLMIAFFIWQMTRLVSNLLGSASNHSLPDTLRLLWTSESVQKILPRCFKGKLSWNNFGIHYQEAATLNADVIVDYLQNASTHLDGIGEEQKSSRILDSARVSDISIDNCTSLATVTCEINGEKKEFTTEKIILATGMGTPQILKKLNVAAVMEVDTFVAPAIKNSNAQKEGKSAKKNDQFSSLGLRYDQNCPIFSFPGEKVSGFPVTESTANALYIRSSQPEKIEYGTGYETGVGQINGDLSMTENASTVRKFVRSYINESLVLEENEIDYHSCRYVRLRIAKNSKLDVKLGQVPSDKDFYSSAAIMDFVPGTNDSIVLLSGLDGYGFKFGSLYGLEAHNLIYGSGEPPVGMEWPRIRNIVESPVLSALHGVIDMLLKKSGGSAPGADAEEKQTEHK